jgi:hypothetical protein
MSRNRASDLFLRAVTIHRSDCTAVAAAMAPAFEAVATDEPPRAECMSDEQVAAYRAGAAQVFDAGRRLVGQLAGLLILVRLSRSREVLDLPDLPLARERLAAAKEALGGLAAPAGLGRHRNALAATLDRLDLCLSEFSRFGEAGGGGAALDRASDAVAAAHRALVSASDVDAGLTMVDFRQACCCCAPAINIGKNREESSWEITRSGFSNTAS